jgi:hypothetical protein
MNDPNPLQTEAQAELSWTAAALNKLKNIPYFARSQARTQIEQMAHSEDAAVVTTKIVEQARSRFGQ